MFLEIIQYIGLVLLKIAIIILPLLMGVAYMTLLERKVIAAMQLRKGPNVVGPFGLLQPLCDGAKLMLKEIIIPDKAHKTMFLVAPVVTFALAIVAWAVIPIGENFIVANINVGVLYLLAISSLGVYGIIMAGWASGSKYSFFGSIRSVSQMISYEIGMGVCVLAVVLLSGTFNLKEIVLTQQEGWFVKPLFPLFVIFFICILAETNRHPFDLPESESELVSGYNVEYSSTPFALFFLGEYANMILVSTFAVILFLGGWLPIADIAILYKIPQPIWLFSKVFVLLFIFVWIRAAYPRYRYDQLMRIGWKIIIPLSFFWLIVVIFAKRYALL